MSAMEVFPRKAIVDPFFTCGMWPKRDRQRFISLNVAGLDAFDNPSGYTHLWQSMSIVRFSKSNKQLLCFVKGFGPVDVVHKGTLDVEGVKGPLFYQVWLKKKDRELYCLVEVVGDIIFGRNQGLVMRTALLWTWKKGSFKVRVHSSLMHLKDVTVTR